MLDDERIPSRIRTCESRILETDPTDPDLDPQHWGKAYAQYSNDYGTYTCAATVKITVLTKENLELLLFSGLSFKFLKLNCNSLLT